MIGKRIKQISLLTIALVVAAGSINLSSSVFATVPGTNQLVSVRSTGGNPNNSSNRNHISANGKVVVFDSLATNILPTGGKGIFTRNLASGTIERINVSTSGVVDDGGVNTISGSISATGRYVVMSSYASNLIDGSTTPTTYPQLYVRDTAAATTVLASQTSSGVLSNGSDTSVQGISSDGRFMLFLSNATNLHVDATDGLKHVYMLDRNDSSLTVLDRKTDGSIGASFVSTYASMSCDGSIIAFDYGSNLIVGDTNSNHTDVYLLDRRGSTDKLSNLTKFANTSVRTPSVSCNGDFIGVTSRAVNLDTSHTVTSGYIRPYIYDRVNDTYNLAAVTPAGVGINSAICGTIDGGQLCIRPSDIGVGVFVTDNSSLTGTSGKQVYIRDIYAGTTELVSRDSGGTPSNGSYGGSSNGNFHGISADGTIVSYSSDATNLAGGHATWQDVFTSLTGY